MVTSPLPLLGLRRLVVCVVSDILYGYTPRRVHRLEEKSEMGPCPRMGGCSLAIPSRAIPLTASHYKGMQFFDFVFLARSWASDRLYLVKQLALLGQRAQDHDTPLTFILYPEGTLVSRCRQTGDRRFPPVISYYFPLITAPQSDMAHTLLPRSTGLHYSLRALSHCVPSLQLLDITVAYPGTSRRL